jgi:hypothetical protein
MHPHATHARRRRCRRPVACKPSFPPRPYPRRQAVTALQLDRINGTPQKKTPYAREAMQHACAILAIGAKD